MLDFAEITLLFLRFHCYDKRGSLTAHKDLCETIEKKCLEVGEGEKEIDSEEWKEWRELIDILTKDRFSPRGFADKNGDLWYRDLVAANTSYIYMPPWDEYVEAQEKEQEEKENAHQ